LPGARAARAVGGDGGASCWAAAGPEAGLGWIGGWRHAMYSIVCQ
jgi:hypothetical protein